MNGKLTPANDRQVFLTAEWRDLIMLNYAVDPALLMKYVPAHTSLDSFEGKTYISLVGFRFCATKLRGRLSIPFHVNFEEVNLRFYVRHKESAESRRGVVFIAEIVPRRAIAWVARRAYGENYKYARMHHSVETKSNCEAIEYLWQKARETCGIKAETVGPVTLPGPGTLEQFITEHYWGYAKLDSSRTVEYHVDHIPWLVARTSKASFEGDASAFYGKDLGTVLQGSPDSSFVADGSAVTVFAGREIS